MGNLLFSPSGRVNPSDFMKGAYVLIAISFVLGILPLINYQLGSILSIIGLVFIWCWIVLFIKRLHDAGKSGWMCLLPILAFIVLSVIMSQIVTSMFAGDLQEAMKEATEAAAESGDISSVLSASLEMGKSIAKKTALPTAIGGAVVSFIIAYVTNMLLKRDDHENQFGPAS